MKLTSYSVGSSKLLLEISMAKVLLTKKTSLSFSNVNMAITNIHFVFSPNELTGRYSTIFFIKQSADVKTELAFDLEGCLFTSATKEEEDAIDQVSVFAIEGLTTNIENTWSRTFESRITHSSLKPNPRLL